MAESTQGQARRSRRRRILEAAQNVLRRHVEGQDFATLARGMSADERRALRDLLGMSVDDAITELLKGD